MKVGIYYVLALLVAITAFIVILQLADSPSNERNANELESNEAESNANDDPLLENNSNATKHDINDQQPPVVDEPIVTIDEVRFAAIGDVIIYSSMLAEAKTEDGYDFHYMLDEVAPYFKQADLLLANQESMIGGPELGISDYPEFNSPFEIGDALKEAGVDVVNIANNHTLDRWHRAHEAIVNATNHWNELEIPYTGAYPTEEEANQLTIVEEQGISFAFLGYTYGTNGIPVPEDKPWIVNLLDEDKITADIHLAKEAADVVVVSYHFGTEYERMPNEEQKKWAQLAADEGAHIVIGHHPHVLQPFTWLDRADGGQTFVAYSLGNFLAAQRGVYRDLGGLIYLTVEKRTEDGEVQITLSDPEFLPTWQHKPNWQDYRVIPLHKVTEQQLSQAEQYLQEIKDHVSQWLAELTFTE